MSECRVLLAHSLFLLRDPKQAARMRPYPPLATLLTAALLRRQGASVWLFDATLAEGVADFTRALADCEPAIVAIVEDNFNFLTKMCTTGMRQAALSMIRAAKARGCRVVANGADASDRPELYLGAGADAVIMGQPEPCLSDLVHLWATRRSASPVEVAGLAVLNGGSPEPKVRHTGARPPFDALDELPFPAWDLLDVGRYRDAWIAAHGRLSWNMATSRGCPYRCNWCAKPIFGTRYTQRSPANVADELALLREDIHPDHIWFADDIFGLTPAWIEEFGRRVSALGLQTPFMMQSRANLMKPKATAALAAAGAEEVWLGVESGSQRILDAMEKGTTVQQVRTATRELRRAGIRSCWFIQLGYPGEAWEDILSTRDLIREEGPDDIGVSVSYPLPGTAFYETVRVQLGRKRNWNDSADLAMMFRGTYGSDFYRQVRDLLHDEVRALHLHDGAAPGDLDARWRELNAREGEARNR